MRSAYRPVGAARVCGRTVCPSRTVLKTRCSLRYFTKLGPSPGAFLSSKQDSQKVNVGAGQAASVASATVNQTAHEPTLGGQVRWQGVHHVGLLCEDLERSLAFYKGVLGLAENPDRPHTKLPYRGAWLWIGPEMIHLMELPDPDPKHGRPEHGGRDRHFCVGVERVQPVVEKLDAAGITYTKSKSGRPAVFFRDPDMNCLEIAECPA